MVCLNSNDWRSFPGYELHDLQPIKPSQQGLFLAGGFLCGGQELEDSNEHAWARRPTETNLAPDTLILQQPSTSESAQAEDGQSTKGWPLDPRVEVSREMRVDWPARSESVEKRSTMSLLPNVLVQVSLRVVRASDTSDTGLGAHGLSVSPSA